MRQKGHMLITQSENARRLPSSIVIFETISHSPKWFPPPYEPNWLILSSKLRKKPRSRCRCNRSSSASRVSSWPTCEASSQCPAHSGGIPIASHTEAEAPSTTTRRPSSASIRRDFLAWRCPRPAPVGVLSQMAWIKARRTGRSRIASAGRFNCSRLMEHLISTPTGPG